MASVNQELTQNTIVDLGTALSLTANRNYAIRNLSLRIVYIWESVAEPDRAVIKPDFILSGAYYYFQVGATDKIWVWCESSDATLVVSEA